MKRLLTLSGIFFISSSLGMLQLSSFANASQEEWQKPYTPSRLEWLLLKLERDRSCGVFFDNRGKVIGTPTYSWSKTTTLYNDLVLDVIAPEKDTLSPQQSDSLFSLCTVLAFSELQEKAAKFGLQPPPVVIFHKEPNDGTPQPRRILRSMKCQIPAKSGSEGYVDYKLVCKL
jgi:hypothetical protein